MDAASWAVLDARAKVAEKRRIYATCLAAFVTYGNAFDPTGSGTELPAIDRAELARAQLTAANATYEVNLIGPTEVTSMANKAMRVLLDAEAGSQEEDPVDAVAELRTAMRRDLGE